MGEMEFINQIRWENGCNSRDGRVGKGETEMGWLYGENMRLIGWRVEARQRMQLRWFFELRTELFINDIFS